MTSGKVLKIMTVKNVQNVHKIMVTCLLTYMVMGGNR